MTLKHDLGEFEGFNFRNQTAIYPNLTAREVVDWDHDGEGEAEFWPAGDHSGVAALFSQKSAVSGSELKALDDLLCNWGAMIRRPFFGYATRSKTEGWTFTA